mmetsp:Transcript_19882/g.48850  ORF Transcript_19882/g.48850 Transcript_19882/m.48850 type:complete len:126 (+) Transcript_19882:118-495(+)
MAFAVAAAWVRRQAPKNHLCPATAPRRTVLRLCAQGAQTAKAVKLVFLPQNIEVDAEPGECIANVAQRVGVDITISCGIGDCGTCEVAMVEEDGGGAFFIKTCVAKVPSHKDRLVLDVSGGLPPL